MSLINIAMQLRAAIDNTQQKCFLCFGTLLFWIRDRRFEIEDDIDIGVIGDPMSASAAFSSVFTEVSRVVDDVTHAPYQITYKSSLCAASIDIYFWRKRGAYMYHCFDEQHNRNGDGTLPQYSFKGIPAECFETSQERIRELQDDPRFGRAKLDNACWEHLVPQIQEEGISFPVPAGYGACLDHWYGDWIVPNSQFGVSLCKNRFTVPTCKDICWEA